MRCSFNDHCERLEDGCGKRHRPSIGDDCACAFPQSVALDFAKGQHLFHQGDPVRGAFSLTAGLVALERVNADGTWVILKLLQPGAFFPCADLFADGIHGASARTLTKVAACFVTTERMMAALAEPSLRAQVMRRSGEEARASEDVIFRLCAGDLTGRVLAIIEILAAEQGARDGKGGIHLHMPMSWRDVAAMVGTSPEVICRVLKRLTEAGRLTVAGRKVHLAAGECQKSAAG